MKSQIMKFVVLGLLVAVVLSACGTAATPAAEVPAATEAPVATEAPTAEAAAPASNMVELPAVDPAAVTGDVVAAGSSTVFPLAEAIAENFTKEGYAGQITIDSIGSGAGFERFCKTGESDIATASRKIKDAEVANCAALTPARTPVEFRVGTDAIAVVVSSQNDFVTDVTAEELAKIFSSDAVKWSDIRPEWPAENILRFSPGTDSGTYSFFGETLLLPIYGKTDKEAWKKVYLDAQNLQLSEDDNVLVQGVEGSKYAIGYFGYAYYNENKGNLKTVSIGGVQPSFDTAEDGSYKLSRPLFLYSDANILKSKPQVASFINYFLTTVNDEIQGVGYFPAKDDNLNASRQALLDALK